MRASRPDAIQVGQANFHPLVAGQIDTFNSCHSQLSLSLFMFWIFADDEHSAFAPDNSAFGAAFPY
jgi:hypothetical protein